MEVKNSENTTNLLSPEENWLDYWKNNNKKNQDVDKCVVIGCENNAEVGAHIEKIVGLNSTELYIIPLCKSCNNQRGEVLDIDSDTSLVKLNNIGLGELIK